jgi:hypothetical protein
MTLVRDLSQTMIMGHDAVFSVCSVIQTEGNACLFMQAGNCITDSVRGR